MSEQLTWVMFRHSLGEVVVVGDEVGKRAAISQMERKGGIRCYHVKPTYHE